MSQNVRSRGRRSPLADSPDASEAEVLDSDEQAELVAQLRQQSATQASRTRRVFAGICAFCAASMLYCLLAFAASGPTLHHQTRFQPLLTAPVLVGYYLSSCAAYAIAAKICLDGRKFSGYWVGVALSSVSAIGWIIAFYQQGITHFTYYWLPFGPLGISLLALYVDQEMTSLIHDADVLETLKYDFKKV